MYNNLESGKLPPVPKPRYNVSSNSYNDYSVPQSREWTRTDVSGNKNDPVEAASSTTTGARSYGRSSNTEKIGNAKYAARLNLFPKDDSEEDSDPPYNKQGETFESYDQRKTYTNGGRSYKPPGTGSSKTEKMNTSRMSHMSYYETDFVSLNENNNSYTHAQNYASNREAKSTDRQGIAENRSRHTNESMFTSNTLGDNIQPAQNSMSSGRSRSKTSSEYDSADTVDSAPENRRTYTRNPNLKTKQSKVNTLPHVRGQNPSENRDGSQVVGPNFEDNASNLASSKSRWGGSFSNLLAMQDSHSEDNRTGANFSETNSHYGNKFSENSRSDYGFTSNHNPNTNRFHGSQSRRHSTKSNELTTSDDEL